MNFIPKPRQRNDIAPFGFLAFAGAWVSAFFCQSFHWVVITKKGMCTLRNTFFLNTTLKLTIEEVMCAVRYSFFLSAPRNATLKIAIEKAMRAIRNLFVDWVVLTKKGMCAVFNSFISSATLKIAIEEVMRAFIKPFMVVCTEFLTCFLRGNNPITAFGQIVSRWRQCLELLNFPTFHGVQCLLRNAGVSDDFSRKGITSIFLDCPMEMAALRGVAAQVVSYTFWQIAILPDVLLTTRRRKNIDSRVFHNDGHLLGCIAKGVLLPMLFGGGRDPALRRG